MKFHFEGFARCKQIDFSIATLLTWTIGQIYFEFDRAVDNEMVSPPPPPWLRAQKYCEIDIVVDASSGLAVWVFALACVRLR
jgi:hypothetical protein